MQKVFSEENETHKTKHPRNIPRPLERLFVPGV